MAQDGDRHLLADPISRLMESGTGTAGLLDSPLPGDLTDAELRRERANLDEMAGEASQRGVTPDVIVQLRVRLDDLTREYARRGLT